MAIKQPARVAAIRLINEDSPLPDTGSLRGDLQAWGAHIAAGALQPGAPGFLRTVLAARVADTTRLEHGDPLLEFLSERAEKIQQVLDRAADRGEVVPDLVVVLDRLIAPLYMRAILGYADLADGLDSLVENTLRPG